MAFNQNAAQNNQHERSSQISDAAKENMDKTAEQGAQFAEAARAGLNRIADLHDRSAEDTKQLVQRSMETVSHQAREATDRFTRTLGFTGEDSERLARQSKQNLEAVTRCGTVLTQAFQDASRGWFELGQRQWQRNLDGLNRLTQARSVQEFAAIQSELAREGLQHLVQDSRTVAETSLRGVEEASKTFSSAGQQGSAVTR
ncbi:phasin family protein [Methylobacterium nigriterrae]|uniref:phasin family protein n=1 Tax=Methylobacterium nigriterrae TaxID=3127512 RepID=UPI00301389B0